MWRVLAVSVFGLSLVCNSAALTAAGPSEQQTASEVDRLILEALAEHGQQPSPITSDEDFLRRVSLDLAGDIPSPEEVTLFGLNPDPAKRAKVINQLLASDAYAEIWASYWKDVVLLRATEQRARLGQRAFEGWLTEQFRNNRSWADITRDLITATGSVQEDGQTGLMFAHTGDPQELTAEISRIFLGIQMSCANCHDHPTDKWKREQFHQLAAYLPRVSVRREDPQDPRSFMIASSNQDRTRGQAADPDRIFQFMDRNRDGKLSKAEAQGPLAQRFDQIVERTDANKDGMISLEEFKSVQPPANQPGRGSAEYYMPDLNDPASKGTLMQPVFFISEVRGPRLKSGADDLERRNALATYITAKTNPWFARAFVNRIWSEMLGEGFYMPIDDMGPERSAQMENVLDVLAHGFAATDYNIQWLFRTIALTQAYQREIRAVDVTAEHSAFAAAAPTRLRSDQIYHAMQEVLGVSATTPGRFGGGMMAARLGGDPARAAFSELFGFDPSTPQEDLLGNVPQALFMMNSPQLNNALSSRGGTRLARILQKYSDDQDAVNELYLLVLSREPTDKELQLCQTYIKESSTRGEAFEDLMWSLLNSTEFLSKR